MLGPNDFALLPALDALLGEVNVTRAAARLGISQPALSAKLARLRDLVGDPLLVPAGHGRGMVLTPRAMLLRGQVQAAMSGAEAALGRSPGFDPALSRATLRILASDNAAALTLAVPLAQLAAGSAPGLRVAVLRPDGRPVAERLESGEVDIAVADAVAGSGHGAIRGRPILEDRFACAQRRGHPRGDGPLDLDAFCAASHLLVSGGGGFVGAVDAALAARDRVRRVVLSVHSYTLAPLIVAESDLLTTLPRRLLRRFAGRLALFEPPLPLAPFVLSAFWHERTHEDPLNRWVRQQLFSHATVEPAT